MITVPRGTRARAMSHMDPPSRRIGQVGSRERRSYLGGMSGDPGANVTPVFVGRSRCIHVGLVPAER